MDKHVNHEFDEPTHLVATVCYDPAPVLRFSVLAEKEDVNFVAKLCYLSWIFGPGRKIKLLRDKKL